MINILKLRKLQKEKNNNEAASTGKNDIKEENVIPENKLNNSIESIQVDSEPANEKKKKKKKEERKEDKKAGKKESKKLKGEKKKLKKANKNREYENLDVTKEQNFEDEKNEVDELLNEIEEIENELKELEEENYLEEEKRSFVKEDLPAEVLEAENTQSNEGENEITEATAPINQEEILPELTENKVNVDPADILRENLLKELLNNGDLEITSVESGNEVIEESDITTETVKAEPEKIEVEDKFLEVKPAEPKLEEKLPPVKETKEKVIQPEPDKPQPIIKSQPQRYQEEITQIKTPVQSVEISVKEELKKKSAENVVQLVGFMLSNEYYGVDITRIREIIRMVDITRVPRSPKFIEGVINLRGSVIPVINLRTKIRMPRIEYDKNTRIIIVEIKGIVIGFVVDAVREVLRIHENLLEAPPAITIEKADYITSVAKLEEQLVILMDTEKVLSNEEGKLLSDTMKN